MCWSLPARRRPGLLLLLAVACLVTLVSADALGGEALRVGGLRLTGAATSPPTAPTPPERRRHPDTGPGSRPGKP